MKKLLALLLTLTMLISLGVTAYAADNSGGDTERVIMRIKKPDLDIEEIQALAYERAGFYEEKKPYFSEDYGAIKVMELVVKYERYEDEARRVLTELGVPDERAAEISGLTVTADLTQAELTAAASVSEIESIVRDIDSVVDEKVGPALREVMDSASAGDKTEVNIIFNEDLKTINDMPSWPDGGKASNELSGFREQHGLMWGLDLLGPDYIDMIINTDYHVPGFAFPYWYYIISRDGYVNAVNVPVADIPRIAADKRVKRIEVPGETKIGGLDYMCSTVDPDDYVSILITCKPTYGRVKGVAEMPSWPDTEAAFKEQRAYNEGLQEQYYDELFAEVDHAIILDFTVLYGSIVAAVKPTDIAKIASCPSARDIVYFDNPMAYPENPTALPDIVAVESYLYEFDEVYGYNKADYPDYKELCVHRDSNSRVDWVLLKCANASMDYPGVIYQDVIGNRVYESGHPVYPFPSGYGIYDAKAEKFVPLTGDMVPLYKDLGRTFDQLGEGRLIGDIDSDNDLTVVDCTLIQRCATRIRDWPEDDLIPCEFGASFRYYSDFDRDGERDIVDATRLQRYVTMID